MATEKQCTDRFLIVSPERRRRFFASSPTAFCETLWSQSSGSGDHSRSAQDGCRHVDSFEEPQADADRLRPMIRELLSEAENERMHLMFFIEIAQPNVLERWLILAAQAVFWHYYFALYLCSPKTAH